MNIFDAGNTSRYVTFSLDDNLVGINILDIREIVPCIKITPVAQAPEFVLGLINLRGQILVILDIGVLLGMKKRTPAKESHFIVFKNKDVGFIVDKIGDVISTDKASADAIPANIEPEIQKYMENIIDLPEDILMILNAQKILSKTLSSQKAPKETHER